MPGNKRVLLIIGGGIAAYKSLGLIRDLQKRGAAVQVVLTKAGEEFVTPLSAGGLSGQKVFSELFDLTDEAEMGHIELSRSADLLIVAPATADLMAKMALGLANDLASTLLLATDTPVMIAPAMNVRMWEHPATRRNLETLERDGIHIIGPEEGEMACGEFGFGRMAEPEAIADEAMRLLSPLPQSLKGLKVVMTSGPTHEPIDPVRYIANRSSGKQGTAIAEVLVERGAEVSFITGPVTTPMPHGCHVIRVETARQMLDAVESALPADIGIFAAAVADWRVAQSSMSKIKKDGGATPALSLAENPDILATIARGHPKRPPLVIGFAAETDRVVEYATAKRLKKGCDWILANDISPETGIMGGDWNSVTLITESGAEGWPSMSKREVAERLTERIVSELDLHSRAAE